MRQRDLTSTLAADVPQAPSAEDLTRRQFLAAGALALTSPAFPGQAGHEPARAAEPQAAPPFLEGVVNKGKPASPRDVAEKNVIKINSAMNELYATTLANTKRNFREQIPMLVALFSAQGGRMVLFPPGKPPIVADRVPVVYELAKAVGHSPMAIYEVLVPYLKDPTTDSAWKGPLRTYRTQNQSALESLEALDLTKEDRDALAGTLKLNISFMDRCLDKGAYTIGELQEFARGQKPFLEKTLWLCGNVQTTHWMKVLDDWKKMLGKVWDKLYAAVSTLNSTRQNNILFTILAQYMGKQAINERLVLLETTEFGIIPEKMLDVLLHIVGDRSLGQVFFGDYYLMDAELLSDPSRRAIREQAAKRGMKLLMPTLAPFHSNAWPWRTDPKDGVGPSSLYEIWGVK
ncbi:MAG: hypothetical protein K2R98_12650 [Gemmataceae bacterium]|nr:hypothetical protein [Gemmataceae bacterium]